MAGPTSNTPGSSSNSTFYTTPQQSTSSLQSTASINSTTSLGHTASIGGIPLPETITPRKASEATTTLDQRSISEKKSSDGGILNKIKESIFAILFPARANVRQYLKEGRSALEDIKQSPDSNEKLNKLGTLLQELQDLEETELTDPSMKSELAQCQQLKQECTENVRSTMQTLVQGIVQSHDAKSDIEGMLKGEGVKMTPKRVSNGLKEENERFLSLPTQLELDITRFKTSVNGEIITFDEENPEDKLFQIDKQFIEKVGGQESAEKLGGIFHQSIAIKLLQELTDGNGKGQPGLGFGFSATNVQHLNQIIQDAGMQSTEANPKSTLLTFQKSEKGDVTVQLDMITGFSSPVSRPLNDVLQNIFCKTTFTVVITQEEFAKPASEMQIQSVAVSISDLEYGIENFVSDIATKNLPTTNRPSIKERISAFIKGISFSNLAETFSSFKAAVLDKLSSKEKATAEKVAETATPALNREERLAQLKKQCNHLQFLKNFPNVDHHQLDQLAEKAMDNPEILSQLETIIKKYKDNTAVTAPNEKAPFSEGGSLKNAGNMEEDDINWIMIQTQGMAKDA